MPAVYSLDLVVARCERLAVSEHLVPQLDLERCPWQEARQVLDGPAGLKHALLVESTKTGRNGPVPTSVGDHYLLRAGLLAGHLGDVGGLELHTQQVLRTVGVRHQLDQAIALDGLLGALANGRGNVKLGQVPESVNDLVLVHSRAGSVPEGQR